MSRQAKGDRSMPTNFDDIIELKNSHSMKWDNMAVCGVDVGG